MLTIVDYSFQNHPLRYFVRKNHRSVKQFGSRSGQTIFVGPRLDLIGLLMLSIDNASLFFDFSLTVKAAPHECVIRTGQP